MNTSRVLKNLSAAHASQLQPIQISGGADEAFVPADANTPSVECVREDGVIRYLDVRCGCGQVVRIVCEYDSNA